MKISVIGLGYVGSVAAAGLSTAGHDVLGIDIDRDKVKVYASGSVPIYEPGLSRLIDGAANAGRLRFLHVDEVAEPLGDVILIATGTPMSDMGSVDLAQIRSALSWIVGRRPDAGVIVMKSTVSPGTGVRLEETALRGTALKYVSNSEFLREGQAVQDWSHPDRIVIGGTDQEAINTVRCLYKEIEAPYVITDITSAEMIKYANNAFLATKISFINEIAALCDRVGATIDDVADGIAVDPRIGPSFLQAGVGYGGSCFPKDTRALDRLALANDHNFELLRSVITVNNRQRLLPYYALRERFGGLSGVRIAVLGLAFKPNTDDVREAPALDLIRILLNDGAEVSACDPKARGAAERELPAAVRLSDDAARCADETQALVLMTEWPEFIRADWEDISDRMQTPSFLFDGRNALDPVRMEGYGFEYRGIGRGRATSPDAQPKLVGDWST